MESSEWPSGEWKLTVTDVTSFLFQVKGSLEAALDLKLINFSTNSSLTQHFLFISLFSVFIGREKVCLLFLLHPSLHLISLVAIKNFSPTYFISSKTGNPDTNIAQSEKNGRKKCGKEKLKDEGKRFFFFQSPITYSNGASSSPFSFHILRLSFSCSDPITDRSLFSPYSFDLGSI